MADCLRQQLGKYRLVRLLGRGGFGDVYLGEHVEDRTQAAIKVFHEPLTNENIQEFVNEAGSCKLLRHESIIRLLDVGIRDDHIPFLTMEYASGDSLADRHLHGTRLALDTIISYVKSIAAALQYAHDQKIVHRDVKPANFLIGTNGKVLLGDFGIAAIALSSSSREHQREKQKVAGTWGYAAPEQFVGKAVPASDQYSLAVVVYEWLCGERPFHGNFDQLVVQHYHLKSPPPPLHEKMNISPTVEQVIMRALAKDPQQRFAYVQEFADALEKQSSDIHSFPAPPVESDTTIELPPISRRKAIATLAVGSVVALGGGALVVSALLKPPAARKPPPTATPKSVPQAVPANDLIWTQNQSIRGTASWQPPALAVWNNTLYLAYLDTKNGNNLTVVSSRDGVNWTLGRNTEQFSQGGPALAVWRDTLYQAFVANDSSNNLLIISSKDGANWTNNQSIGQQSQYPPSLAVWRDTLYLAYMATDSNYSILTVSSNDGNNWTNNQFVRGVGNSVPVLAVWRDTLYMALVGDHNRLLLISSNDGTNWTGSLDIRQTSPYIPALAVWRDTLYQAFVADNHSNDLLIISSKDGANWTDYGYVGQASYTIPALAVWNDTLYMVFSANNPSNDLLIISSNG